jgi:hypothetical protein
MTSVTTPATPAEPLSSIRRLRLIAVCALVAGASAFWFSTRAWWIDSSAFTGDALAAELANATDDTQRACLLQGGVPLPDGTGASCATWRVAQPATGLVDDSATMTGPGTSIVNNDATSTLFGYAPAAVYFAAAMALVALACALRSLASAVVAIVLWFQSIKSLSALAEFITQPVPGLPAMARTSAYQTFAGITYVAGFPLTVGVLGWLVLDRARRRREAILAGTYVPFTSKVRDIAVAAVRLSVRTADDAAKAVSK